jgi:uncharacterized FlaG/YvyC family protein
MLVEFIQTNVPLPAQTPRPRSQAGESARTGHTLSRPAEFSSQAFQSSSAARLVYDKDLGRVFVEIVNRSSGKVVHRFPPKELVRHINTLLEENETLRGNSTTGLIFDQVA